MQPLFEIEKLTNLDLSGTAQHGFKKNRGTVSAGLAIQSIKSQHLDIDEHILMAIRDLSGAFNSHGAIKGLILGPILYTMYVLPLFDLTDLTNFAENNFIVTLHLSN